VRIRRVAFLSSAVVIVVRAEVHSGEGVSP
jgi:hypothetical protein